MALESGHVVKPTNGWYSRVDTTTGEVEDKKFRVKDTDAGDFWNKILKDQTFLDWIKKNYSYGANSIYSSYDQEEALVGEEDE
jgi:hypothetical protein